MAYDVATLAEEIARLRKAVEELKITFGAITPALQVTETELPKREDWVWKPVIKRDVSIPAGGKVTIYDEFGNGYIYYMIAKCDNPNLVFNVDVYADTLIELRLRPADMYDAGVVGYCGKSFWLSRYDTANDVYVLQVTPPGWGIPFRGRNRFWVENPTASGASIEYLYSWLIMFR